MDILEKIDRLRRERKWSINNLAMESMLTQSTLNNLYSRKSEPKISTLRAICGAFGITLSEFFEEETKPENDEKEILKTYRNLSPEMKKHVLAVMKNLSSD